MLLCSLLHIMAHRLPTLLLAGRHCLSSSWPFVLSVPEMPVAERAAMLRGWARSPLPDLRQVRHAWDLLLLRVLCRKLWGLQSLRSPCTQP
jgi:hypothetical protein